MAHGRKYAIVGPPRRSVYFQIIKYTLYMTNLTFQKEGSQFHWMYDLINEFYMQPYSGPGRTLTLPGGEVEYLNIFCFLVRLAVSRLVYLFFFCCYVQRHDFIMGNINAEAPSFLSIRWFFFFLSFPAFPLTHSTLNERHSMPWTHLNLICVILCRKKFRDHNEITRLKMINRMSRKFYYLHKFRMNSYGNEITCVAGK